MIRIVPRNATKGQVVADFIVEFIDKNELKQSKKEKNGQDTREEWQLYVDGASNSRGLGAGWYSFTRRSNNGKGCDIRFCCIK